MQLVGWCLGGILALLAQCADRALPVASTALVASPFDFSRVPLVAPLRPVAAVTQGQLVTQLYRAARRRAGAAGQARLPARGHRQVRDEAVDDR